MLRVTFESVTAFDMAALPRDESREAVTRLGGCSFEPVVMPDVRLERWRMKIGFKVSSGKEMMFQVPRLGVLISQRHLGMRRTAPL
jgi:hypothetical protein